jgi:hypothetical protein
LMPGRFLPCPEGLHLGQVRTALCTHAGSPMSRRQPPRETGSPFIRTHGGLIPSPSRPVRGPRATFLRSQVGLRPGPNSACFGDKSYLPPFPGRPVSGPKGFLPPSPGPPPHETSENNTGEQGRFPPGPEQASLPPAPTTSGSHVILLRCQKYSIREMIQFSSIAITDLVA